MSYISDNERNKKEIRKEIDKVIKFISECTDYFRFEIEEDEHYMTIRDNTHGVVGFVDPKVDGWQGRYGKYADSPLRWCECTALRQVAVAYRTRQELYMESEGLKLLDELY